MRERILAPPFARRQIPQSGLALRERTRRSCAGLGGGLAGRAAQRGPGDVALIPRPGRPRERCYLVAVTLRVAGTSPVPKLKVVVPPVNVRVFPLKDIAKFRVCTGFSLVTVIVSVVAVTT